MTRSIHNKALIIKLYNIINLVNLVLTMSSTSKLLPLMGLGTFIGIEHEVIADPNERPKLVKDRSRNNSYNYPIIIGDIV